MRLITLIALLSALWLPAAPTVAAPKAEEEAGIPPGALYRYTDKSGQLNVSSTLSQQAIEAGYEILDRQGNVIKTVEPAPTEEDLEKLQAERQRQQEMERQKRIDQRLLRLYAGPQDAIRARDRQLEALELNIGYSQNNVKQVEEKLSQEISAAARFERQGKEVPESIQSTIERYQRQLRELNDEIQDYRADMEEVRTKFEPIIERLRELTGKAAQGTAESGAEDQPGE